MKFLILLIVGYYILRRYINVPIPGPKKNISNPKKSNDEETGFVDYEEIK